MDTEIKRKKLLFFFTILYFCFNIEQKGNWYYKR